MYVLLETTKSSEPFEENLQFSAAGQFVSALLLHAVILAGQHEMVNTC